MAAQGTALDAVVAAVPVVEDDPVCNAGTGAVLTSTPDRRAQLEGRGRFERGNTAGALARDALPACAQRGGGARRGLPGGAQPAAVPQHRK
jgi:hypothetical protein